MTRDEHRRACIEAMCTAMNKLYDDPMCSQPKDEDWIEEATAAFDALPTAGVHVVPVEVTALMLNRRPGHITKAQAAIIFGAMAREGNLTNCPKTNP